MNEIELADMVEHIERVETTVAGGAAMFFVKTAITEQEAEVANAELERRGLGTRIVRVVGTIDLQ